MGNKKDRCCDWCKGPIAALYFNYFLSSWGDRMWQFAAGLYLVFLSNGSLRLAAIFGFTGGTLMLIFGGIIGDWVDRNGRMKVVVITLFTQNLSVALCSVSVCLALWFTEEIDTGLDGNLRPLVEAIVISLALSAYLSSMAYKIAIEKDWIVVIAAGNTKHLATMNTVMRATDLACELLAPCVAGILMSYSHVITAICIAVWNVTSVFFEYALLRHIYNIVPKLSIKGAKDEDDEKEVEMADLSDSRALEQQPLHGSQKLKAADESFKNGQTVTVDADGPRLYPDIASHENDLLKRNSIAKSNTSVPQEVQVEENKTCFQLMAEPFLTLAKGWRTYVSQKIVFAGLSLAFLYMTVLGFDSVTIGYIYANGVKESYVGLAMAGAGLTGILGTLIFSRVNRHLGLHRTGMIAFSSEILCLTLTVASIWAPGTVFDPSFSKAEPNCTQPIAVTTSAPLMSSSILENAAGELESQGGKSLRRRRDVFVDMDDDFLDLYDDLMWEAENPWENNVLLPWSKLYHSYHIGRVRRAVTDAVNRSESATSEAPVNPVYDINHPTNPTEGSSSDLEGCTVPDRPTVSILLFLIGVVTSRIGLWMADLVVTQTIQENVAELERGIVNGVQNSLNMLNDMIKFALVIALPEIQTFGILIILSFSFITFAGCLFTIHVWRTNRAVLRCGSSHKGHRHVIVDHVIVDHTEVTTPPDNPSASAEEV